MSTVEKKRLTSPDFIKGIAIILMVYGHLDHSGALMEFQKILVKWIYTFHMPLFLLISGFLFKVKHDVPNLFRNYLSKILRPYLIFSTLYLCGLWSASKIGIPTSNGAPESLQNFLDTLLFHPRGGYWFIHSLIIIQLSLMIPVFVKRVMKMDSLINFIIPMIIWVVCVKYELLIPRTITFFMIGYFVGNTWGMFKGAFFPGVFGAFFTVLFASSDLFSFSLPQIAWAVSILCLLSGLSEINHRTKVVQFFAWVGRNSLGVLVYHAIFVILTKITLRPILNFESTGLANSVCATIFCIAACMVTSILIDRLRLARIFFGVENIYSPFESEKSSPVSSCKPNRDDMRVSAGEAEPNQSLLRKPSDKSPVK